MPVYEYQCKKCGHTFERFQFHSGEEVYCARCGGGVTRLMSPFSVAIPDAICGKLPKGESREYCTECRQGGGGCSAVA